MTPLRPSPAASPAAKRGVGLTRTGAILGIVGLLAASTAIGAFIVPTPASAATSDDQLLIALDISGSMAEDDGNGATKIDSAKNALNNAVDAVPSDSQMGLRTYGGSCASSKLDVPISTVDKNAMKSAIGAQGAAGDTPIAYALKESAKDFNTDGRKTILLVSDGEETCGGDPVAAAKQLADSGIDLCIDVIGFRVDAATRDQLTNIAGAACGTYYDAQDGAALNSRLQRASVRALRPYTAVGTPITGSTDGLNPPTLKPGTYTDTISPGEQSRWYAVDLPKGSTAHFGATVPWTAPLGTTTSLNVGIKTYTEDNSWCDSETGWTYSNGGSMTVSASALQATNEKDSNNKAIKDGECGGAGRYLFEVHNSSDDVRNAAAPLEIVVVIEPPVKDEESLPKAAVMEEEPVSPKVSKDATATVGSGSYGDAPVLEDGTYTDTLRPGEEVFYRVPVDYGQRLASSLKLPRLTEENEAKLGSGTSVKYEIISPDRREVSQSGADTSAYFGGDPQTLSNSTVPVQYNNRESDETKLAATTLPGYYYVWVYMEPNVNDPYFELPINLEVDVQGEPNGEPSFTGELDSPIKQLSVTGPDGKLTNAAASMSNSSDSSSKALAWIGLAAGAMLVLGGGIGSLILLKSRKPLH
ncbi:MAG: VWA domain-containing protein [Corynebacteriales bacterium]|nr:VWA domain-containing protein [Mycobacteriales bacterium]